MADEKNPEETKPEVMKPKEVIGALSGEARAHLTLAFRRILRPLVRILIRAGVRYDEFCETVKGVYVESAVRDGLGPLGKGTRARIAFVTGVGRRDVDRYIDDPSLLAMPRATDSRTLTEVLHLWHTDPGYQGPYGVPLEMDFAKRRGRSFKELVDRVNPDADAVLILDELLRAGVVVGSAEKSVKVLSRAYVVPEPLSAPMLEHLGTTLANLASTLEFNNDADADGKRLEKSVLADRGLPTVVLPRFDAFIRVKIDKLIEDIDDWLGDLNKTEPNLANEKERMDTGLTFFHYVRDTTKVPPISELIGKD